MLHSVALSVVLVAVMTVQAFSLSANRYEAARVRAMVTPLLFDLAQYRSKSCGVLPPTQTAADLISSGAVGRDYGDGVFSWSVVSGDGRSLSLLVESDQGAALGAINAAFDSTELSATSVSVLVPSSSLISIPDFALTVMNELGAHEVYCL
ncbi:MAG: hypothetical protein Q8K97_17780 [Pseudohongiella sp.]|nr:hypothetical protein [Pseudohongiella sp.]